MNSPNLLQEDKWLNREITTEFFARNTPRYVDHLTKCIRNKTLDMYNDHQGLQYFAPTVHTNHMESAVRCYKHFIEEGKHYLNIGAGCGYLEKVFLDNNNTRLVGCDWIETNSYFSYWRRVLGVEKLLTHETKDLFNGFEIYNRKTGNVLDRKFDAVIGLRFNGLWRTNDDHKCEPKKLREVLEFFTNLKQYSSVAMFLFIGFRDEHKWDPEVIKWIDENSIPEYMNRSKGRWHRNWCAISLENL